MDALNITVQAKDLTKKFGDFTAVDHINFQVQKGEIFGFLGPNGSGKTTTIRMLLGLLSPTGGSAEVLGEQVDGNTAQIRHRLGYMSQKFSLYNDLTVLQNLRFYGAAYGLENARLKTRIEEALEMSGLVGREDAITGSLSGGWRQRLALSAAILHRPEVVFLDEPTAGVDPVSRRAFWDLLYRLVAEKITVFVTTHYMDEAEHCHRLAFIQRGRLIAMGAPSQIKQKIMTGRVLELSPDQPARAMKVLLAAQEENRLNVEKVELYGAQVHVITNASKKQSRLIAKELKSKGVDPGEIEVIEPSLEDVFIACMQD